MRDLSCIFITGERFKFQYGATNILRPDDDFLYFSLFKFQYGATNINLY